MRDHLSADEKQSAKNNFVLSVVIVFAGAILLFVGGIFSLVGVVAIIFGLGYSIGNDMAFRKIDAIREKAEAGAEAAPVVPGVVS